MNKVSWVREHNMPVCVIYELWKVYKHLHSKVFQFKRAWRYIHSSKHFQEKKIQLVVHQEETFVLSLLFLYEHWWNKKER